MRDKPEAVRNLQGQSCVARRKSITRICSDTSIELKIQNTATKGDRVILRVHENERIHCCQTRDNSNLIPGTLNPVTIASVFGDKTTWKG